MSFAFKLLAQYRLVLPVITSILLIVSLPPLTVAYVVWFAFAPLYLFIQFAQSKTELFFGAIFFSVFFSGYITYSVLSGLTWIVEAQLFRWFMDGLGFVVVGITTLAFILWFQILYISKSFQLFFALSAAISFTLLEYLLDILYLNFNYGALSYTMVSNTFLLTLGSNYGAWITTFIIVWLNFSVCDMLWSTYHKKPIAFVTLSFVTGLVVIAVVWQLSHTSNSIVDTNEGITVAIIQDKNRDPETAFGQVIDGQFTFPTLEAWLTTAQQESVDMIIYPFNPWSGVLGDVEYNAQFDRPLIAIDTKQFSNWLLNHVASDVIFVTWYTTYDGEDFFNEIVYWQNGEVIHHYQKQKLFPFFDYTPPWAANFGMYSTPIDATVGSSTPPFALNDIMIGNVICSELADAHIMKATANSNNLLLAIGSEAMFESSIPSEFNYLNAQYYAARNNTPVVRATKLGPSGIFASDGSVIASLPYNETGLIIATIPITIER